MTAKTFTTADIRELIADLRQRQARETTLTDEATDALEYLLQFAEWKHIRDEKPSDPEQDVAVAYGDSFATANLDGGRWHTLEGSYPEGTFDLWLPLPPPPQEKKGDEQ
jgi:hypothetical protein